MTAPLTSERLAELRTIAEAALAATAGQRWEVAWQNGKAYLQCAAHTIASFTIASGREAGHAAAFDPTTTLALLNDLAECTGASDQAICVYCGHVGEKASGAIIKHVLACPQNPLRIAAMEIKRLEFGSHCMHLALTALVAELKTPAIAKLVDGAMTDEQRKVFQIADEAANDWAILENDDPIAGRPVIVCLCGSTRFWREFQRASLAETLAGKIVLSIGAASGTDDEHFGNLPREEYDRVKAELDMLHLRKIDLADEVLVLNVGGYIGESTRREIDYAQKTGTHIRYLEPSRESFYDAVRSDPDMTPEQKSGWLATEPKPPSAPDTGIKPAA